MRIIKTIILLVISLIVLGGIFYVGNYITNLKYSNQKVVNLLKEYKGDENLLNIVSFFKDLKDVKEKLSFTKSELEKFANLLPQLKEDVVLKESFQDILNDLDCVNQKKFILEGLNQKEEALSCLKDLYTKLGNFEKFNIPFVNNYRNDILTLLEFLGESQKKDYLVLIQNPLISRPTGGFVFSYGILTLEKGKISFSGEHIRELDDIFISKIIPPEPIQLISNQWFFHDLNWFFDFNLTAKKIINYYKESTGKDLDGVILINEELIRNLLSYTSSVQLTDYDKPINQTNFLTFIEEQVENGFKPGPLREKPVVLKEFFDSLFEKLKNLEPEKMGEIIDSFPKMVLEKDIQIYFKEEKFNQYFSKIVKGEDLEKDNFIGVTFSFLDKDFREDSRLKKIILKTEITKENKFINHLLINAEAKNANERKILTYLKIYLPLNVEILESRGAVKFDKENLTTYYQKLGFIKDNDLLESENTKIVKEEENIEIYKEGDKLVVGGFAYLSQTPFSLDYVLPIEFEKENLPQLYKMTILKQSGEEINLLYKFILPDEIVLGPTLFSFEKWIPLEKDLNIKVNLLKNEQSF